MEGVSDDALAPGDPLPDPSENDKLWLDVRGLGSVDELQRVGEHYGMHALAIEDVANVPQRPKAEIYGLDTPSVQYLFIFRFVTLTDQGELGTEQLSIVLGKRFVLTFQESLDDSLDPIRKRLRSPQARLRRFGPDYLAYALLDTVIDGYYPVLEQIAEQLEALESLIINDPSPALLRKLQRHKRTLLLLRRAVWPEREAIAMVLREGSPLFDSETRIFLRDVYDHIVQIADVIESYRDMVGELTNTYLSVSSNKMNEVMKVLTIMASIFIPLTFMAGIYGMNFEVIPELKVPWAYPALLIAMLVIALGMLFYFRQKGWIGNGSDDD